MAYTTPGPVIQYLGRVRDVRCSWPGCDAVVQDVTEKDTDWLQETGWHAHRADPDESSTWACPQHYTPGLNLIRYVRRGDPPVILWQAWWHDLAFGPPSFSELIFGAYYIESYRAGALEYRNLVRATP